MTKCKCIRWGSLFSVFLVGIQFGWVTSAQATNSASDYEDVMKDSHFKKPLDGPNSFLGGATSKLRSYPSVDKIIANNVENGRITTKTSIIKLHMRGWASLIEVPKYKIISSRVVLMTGGMNKPITVIAKSKTAFVNDASALFQTSNDTVLNTDLSKLNKLLPVYIGFQLITTDDPLHWSSYFFGTFTADRSLKNPTIDDGLNPTSKVIKGTGQPGSEIESNVNDEKTTVNNDGTYALDLKMKLSNHFLTTSKVTITQHNQFGDFSDVSQQQLKMSKAENNPAFHIEDSLSYPPETPDDAVIADLRKRLNIQVDDEQLKVQYKSHQSNLANFINSQDWGSTISVLIYAESPGYIQSNDVVVKITKRQENVIFTNQKSNLYFPDQALPLTSTEIWSGDEWSLSVIDNRTKDTRTWKLTAAASESTSDTNSHDLSDYLWYTDGQQKVPLKNKNAVTILDSGKSLPNSNVNNSKVYKREFSQKAGSGIFIKTDPQMATGHYQATITWTLQMTP